MTFTLKHLIRSAYFGVTSRLPEKIAISIQFYYSHGYFPNLATPQSFSEKLQYRKLYDRNPEYAMFVDKMKAKEQIAAIIGQKHIIPTLWTGRNLTPDLLEHFPRPFVIKPTHSSGQIISIDSLTPLDPHAIIAEANKWLEIRHGRLRHEWAYYSLAPNLIVEKMLQSGARPPDDYKYFVFKGAVQLIQVDVDRGQNHRRALYTPNWQRLEATLHYPKEHSLIKRPKHLDLMMEIASAIGKKFDFARVDLYDVNDNVYFGEVTFYPGSGYEVFTPRALDEELGTYWRSG